MKHGVKLEAVPAMQKTEQYVFHKLVVLLLQGRLSPYHTRELNRVTWSSSPLTLTRNTFTKLVLLKILYQC